VSARRPTDTRRGCFIKQRQARRDATVQVFSKAGRAGGAKGHFGQSPVCSAAARPDERACAKRRAPAAAQAHQGL